MRYLWAFALCLLMSCGLREQGTAYDFYFIDDYFQNGGSTGDIFVAEQGYYPQELAEMTPASLLYHYISMEVESGMKSPFPTGTVLLSVEEGVSQGVLKISLSAEYGELTGVGRTVADYALLRTVCQLPDYHAVEIYVYGADYQQESPPVLREEDLFSLSLLPQEEE